MFRFIRTTTIFTSAIRPFSVPIATPDGAYETAVELLKKIRFGDSDF